MSKLEPEVIRKALPIRRMMVAGAIALASLYLSACMSSSAKTTTSAAQGTGAARADIAAEVEIVEPAFKPVSTWGFEPQSLTVKVGTTITWTNGGSAHHTVTSDDGGATFGSPDLAPGEKFRWTATGAGTYSYVCLYHDWMKATIVVTP